MPVSENHRCIFVHVPKAAGTSIEKVLGVLEKPECYHGLAEVDYMQHWTARRLKPELGSKFDDYFKFAFVRNPWDRAVSEYFYLKQAKNFYVKNKSFKDFVSGISILPGDPGYIQQHLVNQTDLICDDDGNLMVDFVGRFENLKDDWGKVCEVLKIDRKLEQSQGSRHGHYSIYYDEESKEKIRSFYRKDIENFGYEFSVGST